MKAKIKIDCETTGELISHLTEIINTVRIRARGDNEFDFEVGTQFSDNNCYGTHEVTIIPEEQDNAMTLEEAIGNIQSLYPADSDYEDTKDIGEMLLNQAKFETNASWRDLPDKTLIRFAELCIEYHNSN